jgi:hypothetical protein
MVRVEMEQKKIDRDIPHGAAVVIYGGSVTNVHKFNRNI